jgi:hypothetical protein
MHMVMIMMMIRVQTNERLLIWASRNENLPTVVYPDITSALGSVSIAQVNT